LNHTSATGNTLNIAIDVSGRGVWGQRKGELPAEHIPYFAKYKKENI
jgi:hypothetical protein